MDLPTPMRKRGRIVQAIRDLGARILKGLRRRIYWRHWRNMKMGRRIVWCECGALYYVSPSDPSYCRNCGSAPEEARREMADDDKMRGAHCPICKKKGPDMVAELGELHMKEGLTFKMEFGCGSCGRRWRWSVRVSRVAEDGTRELAYTLDGRIG